MRILLAIILAFTLGIGSVAADELWIRNEGGVTVTVYSDTNWTDVKLEGKQGLMAVGPGHNPADGVAVVSAITVPDTEWLVIYADNITSYTIDVACDQALEYITPESYIVKDTPPSEPIAIIPAPQDYDSGPSIQDVVEPQAVEQYGMYIP
jgi:hypothetical protein